MKNSKECPKCMSDNIVRFDGIQNTTSASNVLLVKQSWTHFTENLVCIHRYVCCNCGYTEEWIDKEDLQRVSESQFAKREN